MQLAIGVHDQRSGARADVAISAPEGATLGDVAAQLLTLVDASQCSPVTVGGAVVDRRNLLGSPPLLDGALLEVGSGTDRTVADLPGLPTLEVVGGPSAGRSFPLTAGHHTLGRTGPLGLGDPGVSRRHCRVSVTHDGATVHDLGSSNGTQVDGVPVGPQGLPLPGGSLLRLGSSVLTLRPPAPAAAALTPTGDGGLAFNRAPRVHPPRRTVQVVVPAPPQDAERSPLPLLAMAAPLVLGVVMWRVLGNASFLLFTLLSPVLVAANVVTERRTGRRRSRRERATWRAAREVAESTLRAAVADDVRHRRDSCPDPAALLRSVTARTERLWERRRNDADALLLRVGLADQPAAVEAEGDVPAGAATAHDVPVTVDLAEAGVLGVAGAGRSALARWLVGQAAALHSPRDLQIVVVTDARAAGDWGWVRVLPHLRPGPAQRCRASLGLGPAQAAQRIAELHALLDDRRARPGDQEARVLLVVDGARALRGLSGLATVLADGPALGIHAIALDDQPGDLPAECGATAVLRGLTVSLTATGRPAVPGTLADGVSPSWADTLARSLAPLRDVSRERGGALALPASARWTEIADLPLSGDDRDTEAVLARWAARSRTTRLPLGAGPDGTFCVDLAADGPHALVAGTTGAGKSELLQSLIASLVAGNRPDDLHLLLIDYKGGAAFGPCAELPHTVGLVTDLDGALVERALASLTAELKRREGVLADVGAKDLADLRRSGGHLARLVIVVDEFASLAEELPDFVQGLVGIAQRGRSLGVHLVLATQRPEGVVSADIRANTNLRLCLAVARDTESRDVIDSPAAATISRSTPGRGYARTGHAELTAFQCGRVGGRRPVSVAGEALTVEVLPTADLGDPAPVTAFAGADGASDLALLVAACRDAATHLGLADQPSPWLPPLPTTVLRDQLTGRSAAHLRLALVDQPGVQAQSTYGLDLDTDTHLLVIGAPRSGRTTALLALAGSVAAQVSPDDLHLYALDLGAGLNPLAALPHAGAVVSRDQPERMERVLDHLAGEVARRQVLLAEAGHGSLAEQRAQAPAGQALPHLLLVIDRWEGFLAAFQDVEAGRVVEVVHRLLREGPAVGLHLVITADRTGLVGRISAMIEERLLLRLADPGDYAAAGLSARRVPDALPPGRGWLLRREPELMQLALLDVDPSGPAQAAALRRLAEAAPRPVRPVRPVAALPTSVRLPESDPLAGPVLGVGGDELAPQHLDLSDGGFVIAGPARSGRSTALLTLVGQLALPVVPIAPRPSPLRELAGCLTDLADVGALQDRLGAGPVAVVVDDAELVVDSPLAGVLEALVRTARDSGSVVIAAGTTDVLVTGYRGFVVDLRRLRHGLLLSPQSPADGDLLGIRTARGSGPTIPGRGLLVDRAGVTPVQVALAPVPAACG